MRPDIQVLKKAREMRLSGYSLSEISDVLIVPRSTLSNWLRDIRLTPIQNDSMRSRVAQKMSRGRLNASIVRKSNRVYKEKVIYDNAVKEFPKLVKQPEFLFGMGLYMARGVFSGNSFQFSSSNRILIDILYKWCVKYLQINVNDQKIREYDGFFRLEIGKIDVLRRVMSWQKLLIKYYDNDVKHKE